MERWVKVRFVPDRFVAESLARALEERGVPARIGMGHLSMPEVYMGQTAGGVEIQTLEGSLADALVALDEILDGGEGVAGGE